MPSSNFRISEYMRDLGLSMLGNAVRHATFAEDRPFNHTVALFEVAHAAEILLKSRLVEHDFRVVFPNMSSDATASELSRSSSALTYDELPNILQTTTGYELPGRASYEYIGKLCNSVQYYHDSDYRLPEIILSFAFTVLEPMITSFWGESIFSHVDTTGEETAIYLQEQLDRLGIRH